MYQPKYRITPYLLNLIGEASALRSWIEEASLKVAWLPIIQRESRAKAAHSSTAIEGNPLTLSQVEAVDRGEPVGVPQEYEMEVANYLKVMRWIGKYARSPMKVPAILKLHKILMRNLMNDEKCGKYKDKQNYVIDEKKIRIYTPPSPKQTPGLVKDLVNWLNLPETKKLHSILVCSILHHRLVSIHPFSDGNGRIARALGTWSLYQQGFDTHHIFSLDDFFAGNRKRYYQKIQQARELDNDLTYWIEYVTEGIIKTLEEVKRRIETLQVSTRFKGSLSRRQEELVRILRDNPAIGVSELQKNLKLTRARINQIIAPLMKKGFIVKEGKSRATRYKLASF
ncbi:MAG: Fic family protein [Candidatus Margulisbacteria bacterium]|nr:Fic family protein [Candidatus Margulisiibacteriota bacterium]MBU1022004.1 Fic family protein [Candidatus Margulisiibacteriota bacterium]MBU1729873.1 Fic family protein [Candidatus Margulisiibacteriota bacterium]MBU1955203.1 Fic family protein [Candidatus Margulisiibacteriota bacterium]